MLGERYINYRGKVLDGIVVSFLVEIVKVKQSDSFRVCKEKNLLIQNIIYKENVF